MDAKTIETAILDSIRNQSIKIIGLVGGWGVGKTHLVKELIDRERKTFAETYAKTSYVSLFGLRSIDDVKAAIASSIVDSKQVESENAFQFLLRSRATHSRANTTL